MDKALLQKIDEFKKQTFTNAKIAESLGVSESTIKRGLRLIQKGALLSPMHKFMLTGDMFYFAEEWEDLAIKVMKKNPELVNTRSYLVNKRQADDAKGMRAKGMIETWRAFNLEPKTDVERAWLKGYKKWKIAFLSNKKIVEEGLY